MKRYIVLFVIVLTVFFGWYFLETNKHAENNIDLSSSCKNFKNDICNYGGELFSEDKVIWYGDRLNYSDLKNTSTYTICADIGCVHNTENCSANYPSDVAITHLYYKNNKMFAIGFGTKFVAVYESDVDGKNKRLVKKYEIDDDEVDWQDCYSNDTLDKAYIIIACQDDTGVSVGEDGIVSDQPEKMLFLTYDFNTNQFKSIYDSDMYVYQMYLYYKSFDNGTLSGIVGYNDIPSSELFDKESGELKNPELAYKVHRTRFNIDTQNDVVSMLSEEYPDKYYCGMNNGLSYYICADQNDKITGGITVISSDGSENHMCEELLDGENVCEWDAVPVTEGVFVNHHCWDEEKGDEDGIFFYDHKGKGKAEIKDTEYYISGEIGGYYTLSSSFRSVSIANGSVIFVKKDKISDMKKNIIHIDPVDLM